MDELTEQVAFLTNKVTQLEEKLDDLLQKRTESYYQRRLQSILCGGHIKTKHGISDIETDSTIYEIKQFKNYKQVVGQLKAYNVNNSKKMVALLFGNVSDTQKNEIVSFLNKESIYAMEICDLPDGEILLIELGQFKNDNEFMNWLDNNLVKSSNESDYLELKIILELFTGQANIHSKVASEYKTQIEKWIKNRYPEINNEFKQIWINNAKKRGWFHIKFKKDLSFQMWLDKHIVYKEGSILRLKDVCQDFVGTELHSSISSTFKKELEHWIKEKYKHVKWEYDFVWFNNKSVKGWKNLTLVKK